MIPVPAATNLIFVGGCLGYDSWIIVGVGGTHVVIVWTTVPDVVGLLIPRHPVYMKIDMLMVQVSEKQPPDSDQKNNSLVPIKHS